MTHLTTSLSAWKKYRSGLALARADQESVTKAEQHLDRKEGNKIILTKRGHPFAYVVSYGEGYEFDRIPLVVRSKPLNRSTEHD